MEVRFERSALRRLLTTSIAVLACLGLGAEISDEVLDLGNPWDLEDFFSLSDEANLPTWFSSLLLFSCAALLCLIARAKAQAGEPWVRHWWGLCLVFLYISLDEFATLHEYMNHWFDFGGGVLHFSWVVPAGVLVGVFGLCYLRFLADLPASLRNSFLLAGALYVGGALGIELLLGWWTDRAGDQNLIYGLIDLAEESCEMIGAAIFLHALAGLLGGPDGQLRIVLEGEGAT